MTIRIDTIAENECRYRTVGDWRIDENGDIAIQVVAMGDERYELLIAIHEMIEATLCKRDGVTTKQVDQYDLTHQNDDDPGLNHEAPYHDQHMVAFAVEILMAKVLGVDWVEYNETLDAVWERIPERPTVAPA